MFWERFIIPKHLNKSGFDEIVKFLDFRFSFVFASLRRCFCFSLTQAVCDVVEYNMNTSRKLFYLYLYYTTYFAFWGIEKGLASMV